MIIGFIGRRGGGKTLSMIRQTLVDLNKGRQVYSNIKLTVEHTLLTKDILTDFMNGNIELKNCTVLLDEAHMYMDSRMSPSKRNLLISYFLLQTRKLDVDVYYTTQTRDQVDKRLRAQTDMYVFCTSVKKYPNTKKEILYVRNVAVDPHSSNKGTTYFIGNDYYKVYDTYEIVSF